MLSLSGVTTNCIISGVRWTTQASATRSKVVTSFESCNGVPITALNLIAAAATAASRGSARFAASVSLLHTVGSDVPTPGHSLWLTTPGVVYTHTRATRSYGEDEREYTHNTYFVISLKIIYWLDLNLHDRKHMECSDGTTISVQLSAGKQYGTDTCSRRAARGGGARLRLRGSGEPQQFKRSAIPLSAIPWPTHRRREWLSASLSRRHSPSKG